MARGLIFFVLLGALQPGCHRSPSEPDSNSQKAPSLQSVTAPDSTRPTAPAILPAVDTDAYRSPAAARVVAIGDLHGDLKAAKRAMLLAGAANDKGAWIGGQLVVVQTGDVLDRGNDEPELLAYLDQQEAAAQKAGGRVLRLNGNHEVMNVQGDFRYVTERGFAAYSSEPSAGRPGVAEFSAEQRGRAAAFLPGGRQALRLAAFPVVWIVGDTVFAHGGVLPTHLRYGVDKINREIGAWMRGEAPLRTKLQGEKTPFWIRDYGETANAEVCTKLKSVLTALKAARLVVGHTPQKSGISFDCDRQLARIDVGLSAYYGENPTEVLEIAGGAMRVLHDGPKSSPSELAK